jgi:hypothetical protein
MEIDRRCGCNIESAKAIGLMDTFDRVVRARIFCVIVLIIDLEMSSIMWQKILLSP